MIFMCVYVFLLHREFLDWSWGDELLISKIVLLQLESPYATLSLPRRSLLRSPIFALHLCPSIPMHQCLSPVRSVVWSTVTADYFSCHPKHSCSWFLFVGPCASFTLLLEGFACAPREHRPTSNHASQHLFLARGARRPTLVPTGVFHLLMYGRRCWTSLKHYAPATRALQLAFTFWFSLGGYIGGSRSCS
jgi:hypothetical protein